MKFRHILIMFISIAALTYGADPEMIKYQCVPQLVKSGEIKSAEIYDNGLCGIDVVFTKSDGGIIAAKRPIGLDKDSVLQQYLSDNNIRYMVFDCEYGKKGRSQASKIWFAFFPLFLLFGIPILLIMVILRQSKIISKQTNVIATLTANSPAPAK